MRREEKQESIFSKYKGFIAAGLCGVALIGGYYFKGYTHDVKCEHSEELEKNYPNVMNLWNYNSFWAKMKRSKFEDVMKTPIELYVTNELIPLLYHNSVTQNVKEIMSKTGYLSQDSSVIGQVLNELSQKSNIQVEPPKRLTDRIFKLFVPNEQGYITKEEFVSKFYLLTNSQTKKKEILQIIFNMLDEDQKGNLEFKDFLEIFNEFSQMVSEFAPRLLVQIKKQIRDIIIDKIYDKFDQYVPYQDIPEEKFTIITAEFSQKNKFSFDITSMLIPDSFEKIQEIFKEQSRARQINESKQRVLDKQDFRNCMSKIFDYALIAEKIIGFTLGQFSVKEETLFNLDKDTLQTYKENCIEGIKDNADQISDFLWDLINSNGDEYLNESEFETFFSFLYSLRSAVDEKLEDSFNELDTNPLSTLGKSYKGIFLAKESGSDLSNAHRITRLLKYKNENHISGKKLFKFVDSLLSFFSSFLDTLVKSITTQASVEKQVASWVRKTFNTEDSKNIKIDFEAFQDKLGDVICSSISKFISKLK